MDTSSHSSGYDEPNAVAKDTRLTDIDFVEFIKQPTTICRLISILFAIVVFGCISADGYDPLHHHCIFNKNQDACHYGVAIGVFAFLACLLFLAVDIQFSSISNAGMRKKLVIADLGFSGIWSFLWFVGFCFLADEWRKSSIKSQNQTNHARASIAFSFFSVFTWVTLTLMAMKRYRQGDGFQNNYGPSAHPNEYQGYNSASDYSKSPYASFPQPSGENSTLYKQHTVYSVPDTPFGVPPAQPIITDYNVPDYWLMFLCELLWPSKSYMFCCGWNLFKIGTILFLNIK